MRNKVIVAAVLLLPSFTLASGQTHLDIEKKYGKPVIAYSVSEHIWMTPEYAVDGQICMARLFPKRISTDTNYYSTKLPTNELKGVLAQLAPLDRRGAKKYGRFPTTVLGGGIAWTSYPFERVTFNFFSSFNIDPAAWEKAKKEAELLDLSDEAVPPSEKKPANDVNSDDEVPGALAPDPEIVEIRWKDRKCAGR